MAGEKVNLRQVNLDEMEEDKTYQIKTVPMTLIETERSIMLGMKIYTFAADEEALDDSIRILAGDIDTIWEVPEVKP